MARWRNGNMRQWNNSLICAAGLDCRFSYIVVLLVFASTSCRESLVGPIPGHVLEMKGFEYTSFTPNGFQLGGKRKAGAQLKTQIGNHCINSTFFNTHH